jgi:hypothetical protein
MQSDSIGTAGAKAPNNATERPERTVFLLHPFATVSASEMYIHRNAMQTAKLNKAFSVASLKRGSPVCSVRNTASRLRAYVLSRAADSGAWHIASPLDGVDTDLKRGAHS